MRSTKVLIGGREARRFELEGELSNFGFEDVMQFLGPVSRKRIPEFLASADVGLHLPESHEEACAISILQMMAAGLPIISKPWGNISELVSSGKNGFLVDNENEIVDRIEQFKASPGLCLKMGRLSRKRAMSFDIHAAENVYGKLIDTL